MTSLGKIYSDKETRGGIVVNKGYQVPVDQLYLEPGTTSAKPMSSTLNTSRSAGNQASQSRR